MHRCLLVFYCLLNRYTVDVGPCTGGMDQAFEIGSGGNKDGTVTVSQLYGGDNLCVDNDVPH